MACPPKFKTITTALYTSKNPSFQVINPNMRFVFKTTWAAINRLESATVSEEALLRPHRRPPDLPFHLQCINTSRIDLQRVARRPPVVARPPCPLIKTKIVWTKAKVVKFPCLTTNFWHSFLRYRTQVSANRMVPRIGLPEISFQIFISTPR